MMILAETDASDLFIPTVLVLAVIALLIGAVAVIRKRMLANDGLDANDPMAGFSLASLRRLVKEGKMTPAEYEAAKNQIVAAAQKASEKTHPVENPAPEAKIDPKHPI